MLDDFMKMLRGEPVNRVVWTADICYWLAGRQQAGAADPAWQTEEGVLRFQRDLGIMPYYEYSGFWAGTPHYESSLEIVSETRGARTVHLIRTPVGELREELLGLPESCCTGCVRHYVASEKDLDVLQYVLERRRWVPADLAAHRRRMNRWRAYDGFPALGLPRSPLAALCCEWAGVENLTYLLADCRGKVVRLLELMEEQEAPVLEAVCAAAPPLVHFPDNLDSENLTGLYDEFMAGGHRRRLERLHRAGIRCAVHLDGAVRGLLPKLVAAGFDAIEALTPKPAGDLEVREIRALADNERVILWGGVPGAMFAAPYTWADMERQVRAVLAAWRDRPFVLGVADQVPPDGNIEFCRRIAEMLN